MDHLGFAMVPPVAYLALEVVLPSGEEVPVLHLVEAFRQEEMEVVDQQTLTGQWRQVLLDPERCLQVLAGSVLEMSSTALFRTVRPHCLQTVYSVAVQGYLRVRSVDHSQSSVSNSAHRGHAGLRMEFATVQFD